MILIYSLSLVCLITVTAMTRKDKQTKVIAHRGAWKNTKVPENSIAALKAAIDMQCYGSEFDVHMSADSVLYISHDHEIHGLDIEKSTSSQLDTVKLSNGENLPTLKAYLNAGGKQKKTRLILEIKASRISKERSLILAQKCVELVNATKTAKITDYISFDFDVCKKVKELAPKAEVCYLNGEKSPEEIKASGLSGVDYHYNVFKAKPNWVVEFKNANLVTNAWTVNDEKTMQSLIDQGIDYITTNEPEKLQELLKK